MLTELIYVRILQDGSTTVKLPLPTCVLVRTHEVGILLAQLSLLELRLKISLALFGLNIPFNTFCRSYQMGTFKGRGNQYILVGQDSAL